MPGASAQTLDADTLYRVFLSDGRALPSYGEYTRVGDRFVFVLPVGSPAARLELQLVSVPASAVDVRRTERYADGVRSRMYAVTRGASDYSALLADVGLVLEAVEREPDGARRLVLAQELRAQIVAWPAAHFNYRIADVRVLLQNLDQAIDSIRQGLNQPAPAGSQEALRLAPEFERQLAGPTLQESLVLARAAAEATTDPAGRDAILAAVRAVSDAAAVVAPPSEATKASPPAPMPPAPKAPPVVLEASAPEAAAPGPAPAAAIPEPLVEEPGASAVSAPASPPVAPVSTPNAGTTVPPTLAQSDWSRWLLILTAGALLAGLIGLLRRRSRPIRGPVPVAEEAVPTPVAPVVAGPAPRAAPLLAPLPAARVPAPREREAIVAGAAVLVVEEVNASELHGYRVVEGRVKNASDRAVQRVEIAVDWRSASGALLARETAMIGQAAVPPGGTSSFRVLTKSHPALASYSLVLRAEGAILGQFQPLDVS
jgi:hypothetical protein